MKKWQLKWQQYEIYLQAKRTIFGKGNTYFTCFFKDENKKFVYSTGEKINPSNWDAENKFPYTAGKNKSKYVESIKMQLNRYSNLFLETESLYKRINESFTSKVLKMVFDEEFKRTATGKNIFLTHMMNLWPTRLKGRNGLKRQLRDIKISETFSRTLKRPKNTI